MVAAVVQVKDSRSWLPILRVNVLTYVRRTSFGVGTMSRSDRQQQRAREEIGLALQLAAQDDGGYASPILSHRPTRRRQQDHSAQLVASDGLESEQLENPAPLLATFVMDTPQGRHSYTSERPLMMAETTLNPSVIEADVVTATRTSGR